MGVQRTAWRLLLHKLCSLLCRPPQNSSISTLARPLQLFGTRSSPKTTSPFAAAPWETLQIRGAKVLGSNVKLGQVIQRKGKIFQVLKAQHTCHGRSGATIQVELRDVDTRNKISERFRTDEAIESVFVQEKAFTFLYHEEDSITLMDPNTFEQLEVPKEMFGKGSAYLKDGMVVTLQYYDNKPMSASVPQRVTCKVVEAQPHSKGLTAVPQYKKVLLDNGLTVHVPSFIESGDEVVIDTTDDSYMTRAKE